jgi:hypothetical protein
MLCGRDALRARGLAGAIIGRREAWLSWLCLQAATFGAKIQISINLPSGRPVICYP